MISGLIGVLSLYDHFQMPQLMCDWASKQCDRTTPFFILTLPPAFSYAGNDGGSLLVLFMLGFSWLCSTWLVFTLLLRSCCQPRLCVCSGWEGALAYAALKWLLWPSFVFCDIVSNCLSLHFRPARSIVTCKSRSE